MPAMQLGQGYIFTGVCDSVHGGGGCAWLWGPCVVAGGAWLQKGHVWLRGTYVVAGGVHGCGGCVVVGDMRGCRGGVRGCGIRRDTVNERAVRILLECILVSVVASLPS